MISYFENDQLYRRLECGAKISEVINLNEISDLYSKFGFEKFRTITNDDFQYIYDNWLMNLGYDLVVFYLEDCDDVIVYDSQSNGTNLNKLNDKVIFLWMHDGHYDCILDVGKFLYFSWINFCVKCMKKFDSKFTHICLLPNMCILFMMLNKI